MREPIRELPPFDTLLVEIHYGRRCYRDTLRWLYDRIQQERDTHAAALAAKDKEIEALHHQVIDMLGGIVRIRCTKHYAVPPQNANEITGSECGGCIAEERDTHRAELERLRLELADATSDDSVSIEGTRAWLKAELDEAVMLLAILEASNQCLLGLYRREVVQFLSSPSIIVIRDRLSRHASREGGVS